MFITAELRWMKKQQMAEHHCMKLQPSVTVRWLSCWYTRRQMFFPEITVDTHHMNWPSGGATKMYVVRIYHLHTKIIMQLDIYNKSRTFIGDGDFATIHSNNCAPLRSAWLHQFIKFPNHHYFGISWQSTDIWRKRLSCEGIQLL